MGVFHDKLVEEAIEGQFHHLNPQLLTFSDGSPLLSEEELTKVLQFRRDLSTAQNDFEDFVYGSQFIKSKNVDLKKIFANYKEFEINNLTHLNEVGIVEDLRTIENNLDEDAVKQKTNILNTEFA